MNNIAEQLSLAYHKIDENCQLLSRQTDTVQLIAVSKTKPLADIRCAFAAGHRHFAENYPQELAEKARDATDLAGLIWHFIGPLQSNKTKLVAEHAHWVHSIDRIKIAQRLSEQRPKYMPVLNVLIQINISDEGSKSGIAPATMLQLAEQIAALPQLCLKGLMAIPAPGKPEIEQQQAFAAMQALSASLQQHYPSATELSMGMSDDWPLALRYGATMIRLGTAIFGARDYKKE